MPRIQEVTILGVNFKIGSLNLDQAEEVLGRQAPGDDPVKLREYRDSVLSTIADSMNNALGPEDEKKTIAILRKELDFKTYSRLHSEILNFSGLIAGEVPAPVASLASPAPVAE